VLHMTVSSDIRKQVAQMKRNVKKIEQQKAISKKLAAAELEYKLKVRVLKGKRDRLMN